MTGLGAIPPRDPRREVAQRAMHRADERELAIGKLLFIASPLLALIAGGWAGKALDDDSGTAMAMAAAGMAFAQGGALAIVNRVRLVMASVGALMAAPRLLRRLPPDAPLPSPSPREERLERVAEWSAVALHTLVFLVLALLLAAILAWRAPEVALLDIAWRFLLPPVLLAPLTRRVLAVTWVP